MDGAASVLRKQLEALVNTWLPQAEETVERRKKDLIEANDRLAKYKAEKADIERVLSLISPPVVLPLKTRKPNG